MSWLRAKLGGAVAIDYWMDQSRGIVFTTARGALTALNAEIYFKSVTRNPLFAPTFSALVDLRDVDRVDLTIEGLWRFADLTRAFQHNIEGIRVVIVADSDLVFGVARIYKLLRNDASYDIEVFRDLESAERALGIDGE